MSCRLDVAAVAHVAINNQRDAVEGARSQTLTRYLTGCFGLGRDASGSSKSRLAQRCGRLLVTPWPHVGPWVLGGMPGWRGKGRANHLPGPGRFDTALWY